MVHFTCISRRVCSTRIQGFIFRETVIYTVMVWYISHASVNECVRLEPEGLSSGRRLYINYGMVYFTFISRRVCSTRIRGFIFRETVLYTVMVLYISHASVEECVRLEPEGLSSGRLLYTQLWYDTFHIHK